MLRLRQLAQLCLLVLLSALPIAARAPETGFLNRTVSLNNETYRYQVYVPANWDKKQKWPVILFLHGAGERGQDGIIQTEVGIGTAIRRYSDRFPAIIVMPQCRKEIGWVAESMQNQALKALDQSIKEFNGDSNRLYLTGISMGGYGTWGLAAKYPGKFAAYAPVCGGVARGSKSMIPDVGAAVDPYAAVAEKVGHTPVWIFHGDADKSVPTDESRKMNEALKAAGGNVKYTEYANVGHDSWTKAYAEPELMKWMLAQSLEK